MADDENRPRETELETESISKRRRRRQRLRRRNKKQNEGEKDNSNQPGNAQGQNQSQNSDDQMKDSDKQGEKKKKRRRGRRGRGGDDRYFGRFHCKICKRHWDSARVYTIGGTKIVKYRQRCKMCDDKDAWVFPYQLEILLCNQCREKPCTCLCEDCGKLWHTRYIRVPPHRRDSDEELTEEDYDRIPDPQFEYCKCERRKNVGVGTRIDDKKPHLAQYCEKCLKGRPCVRATDSGEGEDAEAGNDNEP